GFIQDEITLTRDIKIMLGSKVLHNVFTGIEVQTRARIALTVRKNNLLWAAVSRAVRTPSRVEADYFAPSTPQPPTVLSVKGGPDFLSEKVLAYELGYRFQPDSRSTFSLATFYNIYN